MIILRQYTFSKKENKDSEKDKKSSKRKALELGAGLGVGIGVSGINNIGRGIGQGALMKKADEIRLSEEENSKLKSALKKQAKDQGTKIVEFPDLDNSMATEGGIIARSLHKLLNKYPKLKEDVKKSDPITEHIGTDTIILGKGKKSDADVLAHELGHTQFTHRKRSKNFIAKAAHEISGLSRLGTSNKANVLYAASGFKNGLKSAKAKAEGKKEKTWDKIKSVAVPALVSAPMLITEASATGKGLKMLKNAGASKESMKQAKKALGAALGAYALQAGGSIASGYAGRLIGKAVGKKKYKNKNKEEKNKKES